MENRQVKSDAARRNFRGLLNAVEHDGEHITIERWGLPAAVLVPVKWYEDARAQIAALSYIARQDSPAADKGDDRDENDT